MYQDMLNVFFAEYNNMILWELSHWDQLVSVCHFVILLLMVGKQFLGA